MNLLSRTFQHCIAVSAAGALLYVAGTNLAVAGSADDYTGCLTPGGTIIHVAEGASPLKPCSRKQTVIHLDGRVAKQTHALHWRPAAVCEALRKLDTSGSIEEQLIQMGCPSTKVEKPIGTVVARVTAHDFSSIDINGNPDARSCGILTIENRDEWGGGYHYVVAGGSTGDPDGPPGGYVASEVAMPLGDDGVGDCEFLCKTDPNCIAATYDIALGGPEFRTCRTFHYSDHAGTQPWHSLCGFSESGFGSCEQNLSSSTAWWIRDCNK